MKNNTFRTPFVEALHHHLILNEMPSVELSVRLRMTTDEFTQLMNGEYRLTLRKAKELGNVFNTSAAYWLGLEKVSQQNNEKVSQMNQA